MSKPEPLQYETYYHIYNRGNNGEILFRTRENYLYFLQLYTQHFHPYARTFAYSLLPNHFHFGVQIKSEAAIIETLRVSQTVRGLPAKIAAPSQAFGNLCNAYTKAINKMYGRTGSLFENPFGRKPVTSARYFYNLITYIHHNPQKHGIVDDFRDWPYSSYPAFTADKPTRIERTAVLDWFDGRDGFIEAHQTEADEQLIYHLIEDD
jgi:REP element-mobilizing transposase RayT